MECRSLSLQTRKILPKENKILVILMGYGSSVFLKTAVSTDIFSH